MNWIKSGQKRIHRIRADRSDYDWIHITHRIPVPPIAGGSYNFLMHDVLQRRPNDLFVGTFFPGFQSNTDQIRYSCIYIQHRKENKAVTYARNSVARITGRPPLDYFLRAAATEIQHLSLEKKRILIWGQLGLVPGFRRLFPDATIAFAQRHFTYNQSLIENYKYCDALLVQTRGQAKVAFERALSLEPEVYVIPNGVELDQFHPLSVQERQLLRQKLGLPSSDLFIIFPSKLAYIKGSRYLLRLIQWAERENLNIHFIVVGRLDHKRLLSNHKDELTTLLESSEKVTWVRNSTRVDWGIPRDEMPMYYQAADLCIMPGVCEEGFSMSSIEALACGLPVVCSNAGFFPEVIRNGYNGFLCRREYLFEDLKAAISKLNRDKDLLCYMSANARDYAEKCLSRDRVINNFLYFLDGRYGKIEDDLTVPAD